MFLGWSSFVYPLEAADVASLPDFADGSIQPSDLPDDPVILLIRPDGPDALLRGRTAVEGVVASDGPRAVVSVRIVFVPAIPKWNIPATVIRVLRNRYRYEGTGVYHISSRAVRAMGLERAIRTTDNPQVRKNDDRTASMRRLLESLRARGFDDLRPINVHLCRTWGRRDSLRQGHHRVSACLECGIDRIAVHFSAAGSLLRGRALAVLAVGLATALAVGVVWASVVLFDAPSPARAAIPTDGKLRAEFIGDISRPHEPCDLSGLSSGVGDLYWSVGDTGGRLYSLRIPMDRKSGRLVGCEVVERHVVPGARDLEGCAVDPLDGSVWVSDEKGPSVRAYHPSDGSMTEMDLPHVYGDARPNRSLEALAIRPGGRELWICNESPLPGDETEAGGEGFVRLTRFTRTGADVAWRLSGQFAYRPEAASGVLRRGRGRNGVSAICVLAGGEVLVLEREKVDVPQPRFRMRICRVVLAGASDVVGIDALAGKRFSPVGKRLLFEDDTGMAMYEGMCEGPLLNDGSQTLLLISDGDGEAEERVMSLRLVRPSAVKGDLCDD